MKKILTISLFAILFFCSNSNAQTESSALKVPYSFYKPDTTSIPFRGDTLKIIDTDYSILSAEGRIVLANLDFFGKPYWDILKKHKIRFDSYIQKQIERIFDREK